MAAAPSLTELGPVDGLKITSMLFNATPRIESSIPPVGAAPRGLRPDKNSSTEELQRKNSASQAAIVSLSPRAIALAAQDGRASELTPGADGAKRASAKDAEPENALEKVTYSRPKRNDQAEDAVEEQGGEGDAEQQRADEEKDRREEAEIRELEKRDREVRAHEQAHLNALGGYKRGGASYTYETGPNGKQYAVGGEVPVDVSPAGTPEETIRKMQVVRRAALAPAEPSSADKAIAAQASAIENKARAELAKEQTEGTSDSGESAASGDSSAIAATAVASDASPVLAGPAGSSTDREAGERARDRRPGRTIATQISTGRAQAAFAYEAVADSLIPSQSYLA